MLKVIIADDEKRVCNLIINIVPWAELGYNVVTTANNGIEAFERICEYKNNFANYSQFMIFEGSRILCRL